MHLELDDYRIVLNDWDAVRELLRERAFASVFVLTDENTHRDCLPLLEERLSEVAFTVFTVPPGEQNKHLATCETIWKYLLRGRAGRRSLLINLGGGVLTDMGGFCAASWKRGMYFLQIPTTLLSMVDASIGGKLGVDFQGIKNSVGTFANPEMVFIDPVFLQTLPPKEVRSGFAEIVKHALIDDAAQWADLQQIEDLANVDWTDWLVRSLSVKKRIVEADPYERGLRKALNFGHTIGHAVEGYALDHGLALLHGEAVALGMICESWLSHRAGLLDAAELEQIVTFIDRMYPRFPFTEEIFDNLLERMRQDKKNEGDEINFTFVGPVGTCHINQTASVGDIEQSLRWYLKLTEAAA